MHSTDSTDTTGRPEDGPRVVDVPEQPIAVVLGKVPMAEVRPFFDAAFHELGDRMSRGEITPTGPALSLYRSVPGTLVDLEVGFPVAEPVTPTGAVVASRVPATRAATLMHHGNYEQLGTSWERLQAWAEEQHLELRTPLWEVYVTEPHPGDDPRDMLTQLFWAVGE
ncbi:transcriptional regulator [Kocuria dechangensis]|uniref:Transcriptional regulator n=1 Tax=Kocuria dechangensis TaxID=1176249 RepID=A0A917LW68_9MICC|nr:GyrI-like domain-containing protein [Kocuria dechangensis]GGG62767.1 transcriptional regulator [Kocuria dechangensis]